MRQVISSPSFKRAFKRLLRQRPDMAARAKNKIRLLSTDPFAPTLKTHRLKGKLSGAWSCSVEYNCRIIFSFAESIESEEDDIFLIDIGSHDEVY